MAQTRSTLFLVPAEVRHEIYSYLLPNQIHVHLQRDKFCLSACLDEDSSKPFQDNAMLNVRDAYESAGSNGNSRDPVWARRLRSTWGTHWMCEENALDAEAKKGFDTTMLLVCRRMCSEVVDLLARTAVIHVTDLETLAYAVGMMEEIPGLTTPQLSRDVGTMLVGVTHLSITLKLPLAFFQSLERLPEGEEEAAADSEPNPPPSLDVERWSCLAPTLSQLKNLTHLYLSLDHSSPESWSLVNERAVLSPIITHLSASTHPHPLDTTIVLPNLHPKFEREDRHFTTTPTLSLPSSQLQVQLLRRFRQRYHSDENDSPGYYGSVVHKPDFPISIEFLADYTEEWGYPWRS